jgi:hypothetical protein
MNYMRDLKKLAVNKTITTDFTYINGVDSECHLVIYELPVDFNKQDFLLKKDLIDKYLTSNSLIVFEKDSQAQPDKIELDLRKNSIDVYFYYKK